MKKCLLVLSILGLLSCNLETIDEMPVAEPFAATFPVGSDQFVAVEGVTEAADGDGYIVSGTLYGSNSNTLFILKTSPTGSLQKVVTNFGVANSSGGKLIKTSSGNYAMVGNQDFFGSYSMLIAVFDKSLNKLWSSTYDLDTELASYGAAIAEAANGDLVAAGHYDMQSIAGDLFLVQVNAGTGALVQSKTVDVPGTGTFRTASIARNGTIYGLLCFNIGISIPQPAFVKLDNNLNLLLAKNLNNGGGNIDGDIMPGIADGFVAAHGLLAQLARNSFVVSMDGNGNENTPVYIWDNYIDSYCLGGAKGSSNRVLPFGWASITAIGSGGIQQAAAALVDGGNTQIGSYLYPNAAMQSSFRASCFLSDGGYLLAGNFGDDLLLVKLDNNFDP